MLPKDRDFCGKKFLRNLFLRINAPNLVTLAKRFLRRCRYMRANCETYFRGQLATES